MVLKAAVSAVLALTLSQQGIANADDGSYLSAMSQAGFINDGGSVGQLQLGYMICSKIGAGASADKIAHDLWLNSDLTRVRADEAVLIAVANLCPSVFRSDQPGTSSGDIGHYNIAGHGHRK